MKTLMYLSPYRIWGGKAILPQPMMRPNAEGSNTVMQKRLICSLQQQHKALGQPSEAYRGHCSMRRSLSEMLVGGGGLPVCFLLLVVVPLKMFCMGQKDGLVSELAPIYIICPLPNFRIMDYQVINFSLYLERSQIQYCWLTSGNRKTSFKKFFGSLVNL